MSFFIIWNIILQPIEIRYPSFNDFSFNFKEGIDLQFIFQFIKQFNYQRL